jgi:hypothetical protein
MLGAFGGKLKFLGIIIENNGEMNRNSEGHGGMFIFVKEVKNKTVWGCRFEKKKEKKKNFN